MSETLATPVEIEKVLIDSGSHKRNDARIKQDEEELEQLKKLARGEIDEPKAEEAEEQEPDGKTVNIETVQAESDTKQEEEPKAEAQEDDELSAEEKNFKKRYGDLRRHTQKKEEEFAAKIETLEAQLNKAAKQELVLPKTDEELEAWSKEYPDVAAIIETIADKKSKSTAKDLESRMAELEELRITAKREKAEAELAGMHPDFVQIREDDKFHNWAKEQPKWVQDALYENQEDAKSVSRVIDLYKVDTGISKKIKKDNTAEKAAASSVKTKGAKPEADDTSKYLSESIVDKMSMKEYEKRMDEIMEAQRSGKFIYDMTRN